MSLHPNEIEAANRAETTAILIRSGYRMYRSEADVHGDDLVTRVSDGEFRSVQMKSRPAVEWRRYGGRDIRSKALGAASAPGGTPQLYFRERELARRAFLIESLYLSVPHHKFEGPIGELRRPEY